jgi:predicted nucleic acid-binding protein
VIVLDTNVISPLIRNEPDSTIVSWFNRVPQASLWLTTISLFELRYGIELLPASRRRRELEDGLARVLGMGFADRILAFDESATRVAGLIAAQRRLRGRANEIRDTLIAGIVVSQHAEFATRNVRHFGDLDIQLIDPWAA